ncbi:MAG: MotA/TolQ/ExbB proton channel family protein [Gammaproteobacteria bacterium]|nr:MotA/TolQ/ExbB proton channel family protein [Gammaproteobacteria bacterium]
MFELLVAGGWVMVPIVACSIISLTIIAERLWFLRDIRVAPKNLSYQISNLYRKSALSAEVLDKLRYGSPLGRILSVALANRHYDRELMKESVEESGRQVAIELERYLNTLGTIASITPLLGLLGTVIGMIKVFSVITHVGVGDATLLAGGISEALLTTAAGLTVAIPTLMFYRYFRRRVDELLLKMEEQAIYLVEFLHGERQEAEPAQ